MTKKQEATSATSTPCPKTEEEEEAKEEQRSTRWLSSGFEELLCKLENDASRDESKVDFDVVIVGSGYGGAIAARELGAYRGNKSVCVLERGREYLPGMFPTRMADLASHVRFTGAGKNSRPRGYREGLFDVRVGKDVSAVVANGIGGGSLINAGVMLMPLADVFKEAAWPAELRLPRAYADLKKCGELLKEQLGASKTVATAGCPTPHKFQALAALGKAASPAVPITVALADKFVTVAGVVMDKCVRCGDCATGCNHNAKVSLDVTLLAEAKRFGCEIFSSATLLRVEKQGSDQQSLWKLHLVHTDAALRRRQGTPFILRAKHLILAAGTFGSTEILLRSESPDLRFSPRLGQQFSSNGDMIAAIYDSGWAIDGIGNESKNPHQIDDLDRVGPTITGCIDLRATDGVAIQDLAVPGPLRRVMEEVVTSTAALHLLGEPDLQRHGLNDAPASDPARVDPKRIRNTLVVAMMSRDSADGVLELKGNRLSDEGDGAISVRWPTLREQPAFAQQHRKLEELLKDSELRAGRVLANPVWKPLPEKLDDLLDGTTGPMLTVHPLGGCPMGDVPASGVVDHIGRVFKFDPARSDLQLHEGLAVLDGSIIPTSLGINPALTIASVAWRAVTRLRSLWGFDRTPTNNPLPLKPRPRFRPPQAIAEPRPTKVEIVERLAGSMPLFGQPGKSFRVELTMQFEPVEVRALMELGVELLLKKENGRLRIFEEPAPDDKALGRNPQPLLVATLSGSLRVLRREPSTPLKRRMRGGWAWLCNRGLRDMVLWGLDRWSGQGPPRTDDRGIGSEIKERWINARNLASRAGTIRRLDYEWTVEEIVWPTAPALAEPRAGQRFKGSKKLTYSRRGNPWRQLSEVTLDSFPGLALSDALPVLQLDTGFLARRGVPLLRITQQQDQPSALADLTSLALYLMRVLLDGHLWSFRQPDCPRPREIDRLPGRVPGLPEPTFKELPVDKLADGTPVMVRLTRYCAKAAPQQVLPHGQSEQIPTPVLLLHGYSASGTTFAHHAVRPNLAEALCRAGRDVWILDLRSSAGMPHVRQPWTFEHMAFADIPVAIEHVRAATGADKIDIFAHCMGSAMLAMALLAPRQTNECHWTMREALPSRIRSVAISQVPPAMVFTSDNVFRAYLMRYLMHYLPLENWRFRPSARPGMGEQLIDRLLATLPYPEEEFDLENPPWPPWRRTPWVGTRHRMDALYGRVFSADNMSPRTLDHIDDQFGPLNIDTVSQVLHFARFRSIATHRGSNKLLSPHGLSERYTFPVMVMHAQDNGLASVETLERFRRFSEEAPIRNSRQSKRYPGGHQDSLIGASTRGLFDDVVQFFENASAPFNPGTAPLKRISFASQVPTFGVRLAAFGTSNRLRFSIGDDRGRDAPLFGVFVPVVWHEDGRWLLVNHQGERFEPGIEAFKQLVAVALATPVDPTDESTRWTFNLDRSRHLPAGADGLLVLSMYLRSARIELRPPLRLHTLTEAAERVLQALPVDIPWHSMQDEFGNAVAVSTREDRVRYLRDEMAKSVYKGFPRTSGAQLRFSVVRPPPPRDLNREPALISRFVLASCQYPGGMLDRTAPGVSDSDTSGPSDRSYLRLAKRLDDPSQVAPSFMVLAGDQVYVDATAGLFDPKTLNERFDRAYENFLSSRGPQSVLSRLPTYMLLDDHEIEDDWEPDPPGTQLPGNTSDDPGSKTSHNEALRRSGINAYLRHQCDTDPAASGADRLWKELRIEATAFFLADSRTERLPRTASTVEQADLFHDAQASALSRWLRDRGSCPGPRFLVTSAMVLPRTLAVHSGGAAAALRSDAWDGYPLALHRLLAQVYERGENDVVFLSGDAHRGNVTTIELTRAGSTKTVIAHSIHCPALYAPYPFANAVPEDFAHHESFRFNSCFGPPAYRCSVKSQFPAAGDGYALISVTSKDAGWRVDVEFDIDPRNAAGGATSYSFDMP